MKRKIILGYLITLFLGIVITLITINALQPSKAEENTIKAIEPLTAPAYHFVDPNYIDKGVILDKQVSKNSAEIMKKTPLKYVYTTENGNKYAFNKISCTYSDPDDEGILPIKMEVLKNPYGIGYYITYLTTDRHRRFGPINCYGLIKIL